MQSTRHASASRCASASEANQFTFQELTERSVPLNDSMCALSVGVPGLEKSILTL
jgi:hypothetical protein